MRKPAGSRPAVVPSISPYLRRGGRRRSWRMGEQAQDFVFVELGEAVDGREQREQNVNFAQEGRPEVRPTRRSEVATASSSGGNCGWFTLMPMPATALPSAACTRMPATFLPPSIKSLGQRRSQARPVASRMALCAARPSARVSSGRWRQHDGAIDAGAGFGMPGVAVAALSGGLLFGEDHAAGCEPGGGAHGGIDAGVVVDAPRRERARGCGRYRARSCQLQAEADVHGARGMGDGAGGNEVGAGLGVGAHVFAGDAAGKFHAWRGRRSRGPTRRLLRG